MEKNGLDSKAPANIILVSDYFSFQTILSMMRYLTFSFSFCSLKKIWPMKKRFSGTHILLNTGYGTAFSRRVHHHLWST